MRKHGIWFRLAGGQWEYTANLKDFERLLKHPYIEVAEWR